MVISANKMPKEVYYTVSDELKEKGNGICLAILNWSQTYDNNSL